MFPVGRTVIIQNGPDNPERMGVVVGHCFRYHVGQVYSLYLIQLDNGFWSSDGDVFVSVLVCDPDIVREWAKESNPDKP